MFIVRDIMSLPFRELRLPARALANSEHDTNSCYSPSLVTYSSESSIVRAEIRPD